MTFKTYKSKPIIRMAHEITENDIITEKGPRLFELKFKDRSVFKFIAHQAIKTGDFVVYVNADDIYHCTREEFAERNEGVYL